MKKDLLISSLSNSIHVFDMDGSLFDFPSRQDWETAMYEHGFFESLEAYPIMKEYVHQLGEEIGWENIYIMSVGPTFYSFVEKASSLKRDFPKIPEKNVVLGMMGINKAEYFSSVTGLDIHNCILYDDYSKNCIEWRNAGGIAVKIINQINGKGNSWNGPRMIGVHNPIQK